MRILAFDPSSTRTGYAVMDGPRKIVDAGYLRPRRTRDDVMTRISVIAGDAMCLVDDHHPQRVIIEIPSGKIGTGLRRGAGATLAIYGMAVGAIWFGVSYIAGADQTETIDERVWTRRRSKRTRQREIAALFPRYGEEYRRDTGGDVSDAIGIALWWFARGCGRR